MEYDNNSDINNGDINNGDINSGDIQKLLKEAELCLHTYVQARCRSAPPGEQIRYFVEWYEAYIRLEKALNKHD